MKNLTLKKFILLLVCMTLFSCVEGRSTRSTASTNEGVGTTSSLNFEAELSLAYNTQQFSAFLYSLEVLFPSINFREPADITALVQCPAKITTNAQADLYQAYVDKLVIANTKYDKALTAVSSKKQSSTNSDDQQVLDAVLDRLVNEQAQIVTQSEQCQTALSKFVEVPDEADCNSETSKTIAAANKFTSLLNINGAIVIQAAANDLFSTEPVIVFSSYDDLRTKVDCPVVANQNKARAQDYIDTILMPLKTPLASAKALNATDLTNSDVCIKDIAVKTGLLFNTYMQNNLDKISSCQNAINNVKPAMIYVGTETGLSVSKDGGESFVAATGLAESSDGKRDVLGVKAAGVNVYLATEAGVAISHNSGASFNNYKIHYDTNFWGTKFYAHVQSIMTDGNNLLASTWENGLYQVNPATGAMIHKDGNGAATKSFKEVCILSGGDKTLFTASPSGLGLSLDIGANYFPFITTPEVLHNNIKSVFCTADTVFASTSNGISVSTDSGNGPYDKITRSNSGSANDPNTALASNDVRKVFVKNNKIYVATYEGVSVASLSSIPLIFTNYNMPLGTKDVRDIHVDDQGTIYAAVNDNRSNGSNGVGGLAVSSVTNGVLSFKFKGSISNPLSIFTAAP